MLFYGNIKAVGTVGYGDLFDPALSRKIAEITVNRSECDPRHGLHRLLIHLFRRRVPLLFQDREDQLTLLRQVFQWSHLNLGIILDLIIAEKNPFVKGF